MRGLHGHGVTSANSRSSIAWCQLSCTVRDEATSSTASPGGMAFASKQQVWVTAPGTHQRYAWKPLHACTHHGEAAQLLLASTFFPRAVRITFNNWCQSLHLKLSDKKSTAKGLVLRKEITKAPFKVKNAIPKQVGRAPRFVRWAGGIWDT